MKIENLLKNIFLPAFSPHLNQKFLPQEIEKIESAEDLSKLVHIQNLYVGTFPDVHAGLVVHYYSTMKPWSDFENRIKKEMAKSENPFYYGFLFSQSLRSKYIGKINGPTYKIDMSSPISSGGKKALKIIFDVLHDKIKDIPCSRILEMAPDLYYELFSREGFSLQRPILVFKELYRNDLISKEESVLLTQAENIKNSHKEAVQRCLQELENNLLHQNRMGDLFLKDFSESTERLQQKIQQIEKECKEKLDLIDAEYEKIRVIP